uniref:Uncharacterized protein n=1 Tax=Mycena chlorophos TaxID=658473 RepID=A0ABQ0L7J9_MYCCL|nr:predicted protein [Mycena chlorophos]
MSSDISGVSLTFTLRRCVLACPQSSSRGTYSITAFEEASAEWTRNRSSLHSSTLGARRRRCGFFFLSVQLAWFMHNKGFLETFLVPRGPGQGMRGGSLSVLFGPRPNAPPNALLQPAAVHSALLPNMLFTASLFTALLASTASAAPKPTSIEDRVLSRQSGPRLPLTDSVVESGTHKSTNESHTVTYSNNWAGAVFESPPNTYRSVTGTFVVPTPQVPAGGAANGTYSGSIWVGIDGATCDSAILQTGIDFTINNGQVSYDAWYEYYPAYAYDFSGISISAGNTIKLTVSAVGNNAGTVSIRNLSTGQLVSRPLVSTAHLCLQNAEWIVEDYQAGGSLVPFASFSPAVTFTNAVATLKNGRTTGPAGSVLVDIKQSDQILTTVSTGAGSVTVTHT